jgi:protein-disulfide isomerase
MSLRGGARVPSTDIKPAEDLFMPSNSDRRGVTVGIIALVVVALATPALSQQSTDPGGEPQSAPSDQLPSGTAGDATSAAAGEGSEVDAADAADFALGDIALGDPRAPLTVYEYASFTCPHCANFHIDTFPEFKEKYIDTGKVRFILREVYFDAEGLWGSLVARCGGEHGFYPIVDQLLRTQDSWTRDAPTELRRIGRRSGLSASRLDSCLLQYRGAPTDAVNGLEKMEGEEIIAWLNRNSVYQDLRVENGVLQLPASGGNIVIAQQRFVEGLTSDYARNTEADGIRSTPTFIIDGEKHTGEMSFEDFSALLDAAL